MRKIDRPTIEKVAFALKTKRQQLAHKAVDKIWNELAEEAVEIVMDILEKKGRY